MNSQLFRIAISKTDSNYFFRFPFFLLLFLRFLDFFFDFPAFFGSFGFTLLSGTMSIPSSRHFLKFSTRRNSPSMICICAMGEFRVIRLNSSRATLPITHQPGRPLFLKLPTPDAQRLRRHAHQRAELRGGKFGAKPRIKNREALMARVRAGALALLARIRRTTRPARPAKIRPTRPCSPSPVSARSLAPISLFVRHPSPFLPPLGDDRGGRFSTPIS